jgi:hypothetical protein
MVAKRNEPETEKERPITAEALKQLEEIVEGTNKEGIKELRKMLRKAEKKKYRPKGAYVRGYIDQEHAKYLDLVIEYLYRIDVIKQPTVYQFTNFACHKIIQNTVIVMRRLEEEGHSKSSQL